MGALDLLETGGFEGSPERLWGEVEEVLRDEEGEPRGSKDLPPEPSIVRDFDDHMAAIPKQLTSVFEGSQWLAVMLEGLEESDD